MSYTSNDIKAAGEGGCCGVKRVLCSTQITATSIIITKQGKQPEHFPLKEISEIKITKSGFTFDHNGINNTFFCRQQARSALMMAVNSAKVKMAEEEQKKQESHTAEVDESKSKGILKPNANPNPEGEPLADPKSAQDQEEEDEEEEEETFIVELEELLNVSIVQRAKENHSANYSAVGETFNLRDQSTVRTESEKSAMMSKSEGASKNDGPHHQKMPDNNRSHHIVGASWDVMYFVVRNLWRSGLVFVIVGFLGMRGARKLKLDMLNLFNCCTLILAIGLWGAFVGCTNDLRGLERVDDWLVECNPEGPGHCCDMAENLGSSSRSSRFVVAGVTDHTNHTDTNSDDSSKYHVPQDPDVNPSIIEEARRRRLLVLQDDETFRGHLDDEMPQENFHLDQLTDHELVQLERNMKYKPWATMSFDVWKQIREDSREDSGNPLGLYGSGKSSKEGAVILEQRYKGMSNSEIEMLLSEEEMMLKANEEMSTKAKKEIDEYHRHGEYWSYLRRHGKYMRNVKEWQLLQNGIVTDGAQMLKDRRRMEGGIVTARRQMELPFGGENGDGDVSKDENDAQPFKPTNRICKNSSTKVNATSFLICTLEGGIDPFRGGGFEGADERRRYGFQDLHKFQKHLEERKKTVEENLKKGGNSKKGGHPLLRPLCASAAAWFVQCTKGETIWDIWRSDSIAAATLDGLENTSLRMITQIGIQLGLQPQPPDVVVVNTTAKAIVTPPDVIIDGAAPGVVVAEKANAAGDNKNVEADDRLDANHKEARVWPPKTNVDNQDEITEDQAEIERDHAIIVDGFEDSAQNIVKNGLVVKNVVDNTVNSNVKNTVDREEEIQDPKKALQDSKKAVEDASKVNIDLGGLKNTRGIQASIDGFSKAVEDLKAESSRRNLKTRPPSKKFRRENFFRGLRRRSERNVRAVARRLQEKSNGFQEDLRFLNGRHQLHAIHNHAPIDIKTCHLNMTTVEIYREFSRAWKGVRHHPHPHSVGSDSVTYYDKQHPHHYDHHHEDGAQPGDGKNGHHQNNDSTHWVPRMPLRDRFIMYMRIQQLLAALSFICSVASLCIGMHFFIYLHWLRVWDSDVRETVLPLIGGNNAL